MSAEVSLRWMRAPGRGTPQCARRDDRQRCHLKQKVAGGLNDKVAEVGSQARVSMRPVCAPASCLNHIMAVSTRSEA